MANGDLRGSLDQLQKLLSSKDADSLSKESKQQACELSYKLFRELQEPGDLATRIVFQAQESAIVLLAIDLNVFEYLLQQGKPVNAKNIAEQKQADPALVSRVLRCLAAYGHIDEHDVDLFKANRSTKALTMPKTEGGLRYGMDVVVPAWRILPEYLKSRGYQTPSDPLDAPLQVAFDTKKSMWDILVERNMMGAFQQFIGDYRADRMELVDILPIQERLLDGFDSSSDNSVLLVDVGGGRGHEILKVIEKFPNAPGRKVLQDLPAVVADVQQSNMEVMEHDFFTPQPVQGARWYHFSMIFHDWPDEYCVKILENVKSAMKPGYSKILINDVVLPDKGVGWYATASDFGMLSLFSAMERAEAQWRSLIDRAGLKIIKIWPGNPESVIEIELP